MIISLLLVSMASIVLVGHLVERGAVAVAEVDGKEVVRLELSIDNHRVVHGRLGDTSIQVQDGRVRVISSACPHKECVRSGWISRAGQMIACLPNGVVVRVEGEGKKDEDVNATTW